jgi:cell wall-associated NlpC family hydrolase
MAAAQMFSYDADLQGLLEEIMTIGACDTPTRPKIAQGLPMVSNTCRGIERLGCPSSEFMAIVRQMVHGAKHAAAEGTEASTEKLTAVKKAIQSLQATYEKAKAARTDAPEKRTAGAKAKRDDAGDTAEGRKRQRPGPPAKVKRATTTTEAEQHESLQEQLFEQLKDVIAAAAELALLSTGEDNLPAMGAAPLEGNEPAKMAANAEATGVEISALGPAAKLAAATAAAGSQAASSRAVGIAGA